MDQQGSPPLELPPPSEHVAASEYGAGPREDPLKRQVRDAIQITGELLARLNDIQDTLNAR
eukprot:5862867-Prorocentrum_lima.AAC.1